MAIVKNSFRLSKLEGDVSPANDDDSSDGSDGELRWESGSDGEASDGGDSGMGPDDYDLSELGEAETELCQVGDQSCSIPLGLYELEDLRGVLSLKTWNGCLSEEERLALSVYLPDMDQETFARTLSELFAGENFHFGSPLAGLFGRMKGGLCEPTAVLYRRGLNMIQRRQHYHRLRAYHNSMLGKLARMRDAWKNCGVYRIEERLRLLSGLGGGGRLTHRGNAAYQMGMESEDSEERHRRKRVKTARSSIGTLSPASGMGLKPNKCGKENPKGILKIAVSKGLGKKGYTAADDHHPPSAKHAAGKRLPPLSACRKGHVAANTGHAVKTEVDEADEYDAQDRDSSRINLMKPGKKQRFDAPAQYHDEASGPRLWHSRRKILDHRVTVGSYGTYQESGGLKKAKYAEGLDTDQYVQKEKMHVELKPVSHHGQNGDRNIEGKKWKMTADLKSRKGKTGSESKLVHEHPYDAQADGARLLSDPKSLPSRDQSKAKYCQNGTADMEFFRNSPKVTQSEETESYSSDDYADDEHVSPHAKVRYPVGAVLGHGSGVLKSVYDSKNANNFYRKDTTERLISDGGLYTKASGDDTYGMKGKKKGKTKEAKDLRDFNLAKKGQLHHLNEKKPEVKIFSTQKKRKGVVTSDDILLESNYIHDHGSSPFEHSYVEPSGGSRFLDGQMVGSTPENIMLTTDADVPEMDFDEKSTMPLSVCNTITNKWKGKSDAAYRDEPDGSVHMASSPNNLIANDPVIIKKKKNKKKIENGIGPLNAACSDLYASVSERADTELVMKPEKKPFSVITPTVHSGFSFSVVHLLSAVRKAMISHIEDSASIINNKEMSGRKSSFIREDQNREFQGVNNMQQSLSQEFMDLNTLENSVGSNFPALIVQEIVNRVKSNPLDSCILETQEPIQDLVKGVLKVFSSKTAPLGAKGWKALVTYEKSSKAWSWIGPVSTSLCDNYSVVEDTSPDAWGIPHKMLVKLVDAFANWLKSGQETLQQIGSLPAPPEMPPFLHEKERFKDLRAQKSLNTISPSSDEVQAYFRREEYLRYLVPDRAFSYTALDGKKSFVAPLRRGGWKPTSKARGSNLLKADRPPHVTILCLVRDAAARLPGSIGTRADVCTLIRDSQYILDATDAQVNQAVSGALDRLHYKRDPCVMFDSDRKLWVYLHRDREEEDFEDDGTSSTKKWKKQRKDGMEQSDIGAANDISYNASGAGYDDPNVNSSPVQVEDKAELVYDDLRPTMDNVQSFVDTTSRVRIKNNPGSWDPFGIHPSRQNKVFCHENSANKDFDDETFSRERPDGPFDSDLL